MFRNVLLILTMITLLEYSKANSVDDTFLNIPFKWDEVSKAVHELNSGKASGFDGVSAEHICYAGDSIVTSLTILCNAVRVSECVPPLLPSRSTGATAQRQRHLSARSQ